jgi:hypothetical protein
MSTDDKTGLFVIKQLRHLIGHIMGPSDGVWWVGGLGRTGLGWVGRVGLGWVHEWVG